MTPVLLRSLSITFFFYLVRDESFCLQLLFSETITEFSVSMQYTCKGLFFGIRANLRQHRALQQIPK